MTPDIIYPHQLAEILDVKPRTLNKRILSGDLPPLDKTITQKTRYWFRSTLVAAGFLPAGQVESGITEKVAA